MNISSSGVLSIYLFLVTHYPTTRNKMETGSSAEVVDVLMASVDGSIRRDDDFIEGALFSDGSTRAELDECAVSLGLDPGDYEDKFHLRRALSAQLTQQSIDDRLAAYSAQTPHVLILSNGYRYRYSAPPRILSIR